LAAATGPATDHTPVILSITERRGSSGSTKFVHKDIRFTDGGGDARVAVNKLISSTHPIQVLDDKIQTPSEAQKTNATLTSSWACSDPYLVAVEYSIVDRAGNRSEPWTVMVDCSADASSQGAAAPLIMGSGAGLGLLATGIVLVRRRRGRRSAGLPASSGSEI